MKISENKKAPNFKLPSTNGSIFELSKIKNLRLLGRFGVGEYDNSDYALESGINLSKFILNEVRSETYVEYRKKGKDNIIVG